MASSVQSERCSDGSISMDDSVLPSEDYFTWSYGFHLHDSAKKRKKQKKQPKIEGRREISALLRSVSLLLVKREREGERK